MTDNSEPAREAVLAEIKEYTPAGGESVMIWVNNRDTRRGGYCLECVPRRVAPAVAAALSASSAPATGVEAVAVPAGWKLVPVEPTRAMKDAVSRKVDDFTREHARLFVSEIWQDMLSASPAATRGEPVAWRYRRVIDGKPMPWRYSDEAHPDLPGGPDERQPLYATPPAPAESARVKVKPLVWRCHPGDWWSAQSILGEYAHGNAGWYGPDGSVHPCPGKDACQAAAQADYESRIRASLATDAEG